LVPTPNLKALIINVFALSAIENTIIRATRSLSHYMALPFYIKKVSQGKKEEL
jgi:hypothetical protein